MVSPVSSRLSINRSGIWTVPVMTALKGVSGALQQRIMMRTRSGDTVHLTVSFVFGPAYDILWI